MGSLGCFPERRGPGDSIPCGTLLVPFARERTRVATAGGFMTRHEAYQCAWVLLLLTCRDLFEAQGVIHLINGGSLIFDISTICMITIGVALSWMFYAMLWIRFRGIWP